MSNTTTTFSTVTLGKHGTIRTDRKSVV